MCVHHMCTVSSFYTPVRFFFSNFSTVISTRGLRFFVANKCASGASRLSRVEFHVSSVLTRLEKAIVFLLHQFLFSFCALSPPFFLLNGPAIYSRVNKNELPPVFKGNREITRLASKLVRLTREGGTFFLSYNHSMPDKPHLSSANVFIAPACKSFSILHKENVL